MSANWIAVDWGTSSLRIWAMGPNGVEARASSDRGMSTLTPDTFEDALLALADGWIDGPTTVVACGMVGARQGWIEAAYRTVPCAPLDAPYTIAPTRDPRLTVHIVPGLSQTTPPDVMRGEETQIAGFLALNPHFDGILCLPGTHTKWVHVSAGEVVSFRTVMTGETFAALSGHTVLRHSLGGKAMDDTAFDDAVSGSLSRPDSFFRDLFALRAADLLASQPPSVARGKLSGGLIGLELAATRPYWLGQAVALIGDDALCALYARALATQGVEPQRSDPDAVTLAGLARAYQALKEPHS